MAAGTLTPAWAVRILGGDATTNGFLQSARGAGALISSVWISSLGRFNYKGKIVTVGTLVMPLALFVFAEARWLPLSLLSLMAFGMAFIPVLNLGNAIVQTAVPDALRGRVMSMWSLMLFGMWPLGGLWAGATAERFGEPSVVIIGAVVTMIVALVVFFRFPRLRQTE
jgi:predicted MFS family arabinose efflux permease